MSNLVIEMLAFEHKKAPGYESFILSLLDKLYEKRENIKHEKIFLVICDGQEQYFKKYAEKFELKTFKVKGIISRMMQLEKISKNLNLSKEDTILHTAGYGSRKRKNKTILVVHDLQYLHLPQYWSKLKLLHRKIYVKKSLKNADKIVAISNCTKNDILNNFNIEQEKIETIYNIVNFFSFEESHETGEKYSGEKFFLCVSSAARHKNIITLLRAFSIFLKSYPQYKLFLTVKFENLDDESKQIVKNIEANLNCLNYVNKSELAALYKNCEAFVLPTLFEGFGLPIVEAQFFGKTPIISDIPICREIGGDNSIYFNAKDEEQLAEILKSFVENKETKKDFSNDVFLKYDSENIVSQYIRLINSI